MRGTGIGSAAPSARAGGEAVRPRRKAGNGGKTPEGQKPRDEKPSRCNQYVQRRSSCFLKERPRVEYFEEDNPV